MPNKFKKILVIGGAGFIGSAFIKEMLKLNFKIIVVDNLSSGSINHIDTKEVKFFQMDINNVDLVLKALKNQKIDEVWHFAANSNIQEGNNNIDIDLNNTFISTVSTLKVMREIGCKNLFFSSSSAIYGFHNKKLYEDIGPLMPISNYGAMKLSSEAIIFSSFESFLENVCIFRFPNVVGLPATHGIIIDLIRKLKKDKSKLEVLGNGTQRKNYLHVSELIDAMMFIKNKTKKGIKYFNIGAMDDGVFVYQIVDLIVKQFSPEAKVIYQKSNSGWKGDIPKYFYSIEKLNKLGWFPKMSSYEAVKLAIREIAFQENIF